MKTLFFLVIIFLKTVSSQTHYCENMIKVNSTESDIKSSIQRDFELIKEEPNCIEQLLRQGFHSSAELFLSMLMKNKINYKENLNMAIQKINYQFDHIQNLYKFVGGDILKSVPATAWAQSLSHIYLQIKFSHLHDAPGCLEVTQDSLEVEKNKLVFTGFCAIGDFPIKFNLTLTLFDEVILEESSKEKSSSVGRITVTFKKVNSPKYWKSLQTDSAEVIGNLKIWYDMKNRFIDELREFEPEKPTEDDDSENKKVRRRKKKFSIKNGGLDDSEMLHRVPRMSN